jgi:hypothetical protein
MNLSADFYRKLVAQSQQGMDDAPLLAIEQQSHGVVAGC